MPITIEKLRTMMKYVETIKPHLDERYTGMNYSDGMIQTLAWAMGELNDQEFLDIEEVFPHFGEMQ